MKTSIKTLIASTLTAIVLTTSAFAPSASAADIKPFRMVTSGFKKIVVTGNVDVKLVQNQTEGIVAAPNNNGARIKASRDGDILRISSDSKTRAKVIVYVKDIYRVDASGNSFVETHGELNLKYLQVIMDDNACANINAKTESTYTLLKGDSRLYINELPGQIALNASLTRK